MEHTDSREISDDDLKALHPLIQKLNPLFEKIASAYGRIDSCYSPTALSNPALEHVTYGQIRHSLLNRMQKLAWAREIIADGIKSNAEDGISNKLGDIMLRKSISIVAKDSFTYERQSLLDAANVAKSDFESDKKAVVLRSLTEIAQISKRMGEMTTQFLEEYPCFQIDEAHQSNGRQGHASRVAARQSNQSGHSYRH